MCVCVRVISEICVRERARVGVCVYLRACVRLCIYMCVCVSSETYVCNLCVCARVSACMHVCVVDAPLSRIFLALFSGFVCLFVCLFACLLPTILCQYIYHKLCQSNKAVNLHDSCSTHLPIISIRTCRSFQYAHADHFNTHMPIISNAFSFPASRGWCPRK